MVLRCLLDFFMRHIIHILYNRNIVIADLEYLYMYIFLILFSMMHIREISKYCKYWCHYNMQGFIFKTKIWDCKEECGCDTFLNI